MRWANGRGTTLEVVAAPSADAWDWRLSIAEVVEDGPFSYLPGIDRLLVVASGDGMTLHTGTASHPRTTLLHRYDIAAFSGDDDTTAELQGGPVRDLNLMVRRNSSGGRPGLRVVHLEPGATVPLAGVAAVVVLDGEVTAKVPDWPPSALGTRFDAFIAEPADLLADRALVAGSASVLALVAFTTVPWDRDALPRHR
jgi:uncharacterized protein